VRGTVLYAHFFALQLINAGELALLTDEQRNQAFDSLIPGLKFRRFDAVMAGMDITPEREKQVLGEGTGGIDLFTQRVSQIHIETDDLVVGVHQLKHPGAEIPPFRRGHGRDGHHA
jgi:hypothetical protein